MSGVFYNMLTPFLSLLYFGQVDVVWFDPLPSKALARDPAGGLLSVCVRLVQVTPVSPLQYLIATNICVYYWYLPHPMPWVLSCLVDLFLYCRRRTISNFFSFVTIVIYGEAILACYSSSFSFLLWIMTRFKSSVGIVVRSSLYYKIKAYGSTLLPFPVSSSSI